MNREKPFDLPPADLDLQQRAFKEWQAYRKAMVSLFSVAGIKKERMSPSGYALHAFLYPVVVGNADSQKILRLPPHGLIILSHTKVDAAVAFLVKPFDKKADGYRRVAVAGYSGPGFDGVMGNINIYRKDQESLEIRLPFDDTVSTLDYKNGEFYEKWRAVDVHFDEITNKWKAGFLNELMFDTKGLDFWKRVREYESKYPENETPET